MEPFMPQAEKECLKRYLSKSSVYFEYGSGGSTHYAINSPIKKIYSVESDVKWMQNLSNNPVIKNAISDGRLQFIPVDLGCVANKWGYPGKNCPSDSMKKYSDSFSTIPFQFVETILIDGRFRTACALKLYNYISDSSNILFDDFVIRPEYHIVTDYYNIIETIGRMVVLNKKPNQIIPNSLIEKYETDPR